MSAPYSDPTFEAVARIEERGCKNCKWKQRLWGVEVCTDLRKPAHQRPSGSNNMRGCGEWQRKGGANGGS